MPEYDLAFSSSAAEDGGTFRLLELPSDLVQLVDAAVQNSAPVTFTIKGQPNEDAVLCTNDRTFALRSVALSNSVLVVTPPSSDPDSGRELVVIRDEVHEILELLPAVPRLHKMTALLKGKEYNESDEADHDSRESASYYSYEDAKRDIQASDAEIEQGLREKRILVIKGALRPISREYLLSLLELVLNLLVSLSLPHESVPLEDLVSALADDHEVSRTVSMQLMSWFGEVGEQEGKWKMNVEAVLKEVGLGILRHHRRDPVERDVFIAKWKSVVGDTFESSVNLDFLSGNYLVSTPDGKDLLTFFSSSELPIDPAARFAELFLTRPRWKEDDIAPFLTEIAVNSKERDKLLLKYCRAITDTQGVWYTSRTQYNG